MLTSCCEQEGQTLAFSQVALASIPSKCQRMAMTDRTSSNTSQAAMQYYVYNELRQTKKQLQAYRQYFDLDQLIRHHSQSTNCRDIFQILDNFKQNFKILYSRQDSKQQIFSLFLQLKRSFQDVNKLQQQSPSLKSNTNSSNSNNSNNDVKNMQLVQTIYEKIAQIQQLKKQLQQQNISPFTALQKSFLPQLLPHQTINIKQFNYQQSCQACIQTQLDQNFIPLLKGYKHLYKRYISCGNLIYKLMYKLSLSQYNYMKQYHKNNNELLIWYSKFKFKLSKYNLQEASEYIEQCNRRAKHLQQFTDEVNKRISIK